jgi:hypothetical protein
MFIPYVRIKNSKFSQQEVRMVDGLLSHITKNAMGVRRYPVILSEINLPNEPMFRRTARFDGPRSFRRRSMPAVDRTTGVGSNGAAEPQWGVRQTGDNRGDTGSRLCRQLSDGRIICKSGSVTKKQDGMVVQEEFTDDNESQAKARYDVFEKTENAAGPMTSNRK